MGAVIRLVVGQLAQGRAFGAKGPFIDRMVGIPLDIDDFPRARFSGAADHATAHRTITADADGFLGVRIFRVWAWL
jgi:hypothetical protein